MLLVRIGNCNPSGAVGKAENSGRLEDAGIEIGGGASGLVVPCGPEGKKCGSAGSSRTFDDENALALACACTIPPSSAGMISRGRCRTSMINKFASWQKGGGGGGNVLIF